MTELLLVPGQSPVGAWLRQSSDVRTIDERCWQLSLDGGVPLRVSAMMDDPFLLFDAPAPVTCEFAQAPQWLGWNMLLSGNAKLAFAPKPWRLRLRAEIPVNDDDDTQARIAETVAGLSAACRLLQQGSAASNDTVSTHAATDPANASRGLPVLLQEIGWPFQERASGASTVELAIRNESCRVLLEEDSSGIRAGIEFLQIHAITACARLAIAAMLLSAAGSVRFARPFATDVNDDFACGYEVKLAGGTSAGELEHALEALAVACWACKLEAQSLLDNSVAESYLAIRNFSPTLAREEF
jgi:hypothetical protein